MATSSLKEVSKPETKATEGSTEKYIGEHVRLWPYIRGYYARDTMYHLWRMIEEDQAGPQLFWGCREQANIHMDLTGFCQYFHEPNRFLIVFQSIKDNGLAGLVWYDDIVPKFRAVASIYMRKRYRGKPTIEAMRFGLQYAFDQLQLTSLWGVTPWQPALQICLRSGFERVATLENFILQEEKPQHVFICRITKEQFNNGQRLS